MMYNGFIDIYILIQIQCLQDLLIIHIYLSLIYSSITTVASDPMLAQSPNKIEINGKALCLEASPGPKKMVLNHNPSKHLDLSKHRLHGSLHSKRITKEYHFVMKCSLYAYILSILKHCT